MVKTADDSRARLIRAAYQEFANYDYQHASSNRIVKRAGVGKGALFYHFKNKAALFCQLVEAGLALLEAELFSALDDAEPDLIARYRRFARAKLGFYVRHPEVLNFFAAIYLRGDLARPEFHELGAKVRAAQQQQQQRLWQGIDTSRFRQELEPQAALALVRWAIGGYEAELSARLKAGGLSQAIFEAELSAFEGFLDTLERALYGGDHDHRG